MDFSFVMLASMLTLFGLLGIVEGLILHPAFLLKFGNHFRHAGLLFLSICKGKVIAVGNKVELAATRKPANDLAY